MAVDELQKVKATYQPEGRHSLSGQSFSTHSRSSTRRGSLIIYQYEKATPALNSTDPQRTPSLQSRTNSDGTMAPQSFEKANLIQRPSVADMLYYITILVPWLAFVSFVYTVCTLPVLGITCVTSNTKLTRSVMAIMSSLFDKHHRRMHVDEPGTTARMVLMNLTTPLVAIFIGFFGCFAALSSVYSLLLSEEPVSGHDGEKSSLDRAISCWHAWLSLFTPETTAPRDEV